MGSGFVFLAFEGASRSFSFFLLSRVSLTTMPKNRRKDSSKIRSHLSSKQRSRLREFYAIDPSPTKQQLEQISRIFNVPEELVQSFYHRLDKAAERRAKIPSAVPISVPTAPDVSPEQKQCTVVSNPTQIEVSLKSAGIQTDPVSAPTLVTSMKPRSLKFFPEPKKRIPVNSL